MQVDVSGGGGPRFKVGDQIILVGPGYHNGMYGEVAGVIESSFDQIYRYCVRFSDGRSAPFFSYELHLLRSAPTKSAAA